MTDATTSQHVAGNPVPADGIPGEGITGFVVRGNASKRVAGDLITHSSEVTYQFGRTVTEVDMVEPHDRMSKFATDLAERVVADRVAQAEAAQAQLAATVPAPAPAPVAAQPDPGVPVPQAPAPYVPGVPAPAPQQAAPVQAPVQQQAGAVPPFESWPEGQKPNGHGTFKYLPTSVVSSDAFKAAIAQRIREAGDNPDLLAIYDERTGNRGLESGGQNYGVASVKPLDHHPFAQDPRAKSAQGNMKSVYYVDFQKDGSVTVKATNDYSTWLEVQRQVAAQMAAQQQVGQ